MSTNRTTVLSLSMALTMAMHGGVVHAAEGAESPEALVKKLNSLDKLGDFIAFVNPDDRVVYGSLVAMLGAFSALARMGPDGKAEEGKKIEQEWDALLAKHKVVKPGDDEAPAEGPEEMKMRDRLRFKNVDMVAFLNDAQVFMNKYRLGEDDDLPIPHGKLEGLKVQGDTATGKLDGADVAFVKVEGRWYLKAEI